MRLDEITMKQHNENKRVTKGSRAVAMVPEHNTEIFEIYVDPRTFVIGI
jgi:hypothetical protein